MGKAVSPGIIMWLLIPTCTHWLLWMVMFDGPLRETVVLVWVVVHNSVRRSSRVEGQRHLVFTLGKCKDGVPGPPREGVRCAFAFPLLAAPSELGVQKLKSGGS